MPRENKPPNPGQLYFKNIFKRKTTVEQYLKGTTSPSSLAGHTKGDACIWGKHIEQYGTQIVAL